MWFSTDIQVFAVGRAELLAGKFAHQFYRNLFRTRVAELLVARNDAVKRETEMVEILTNQR